MLVFSLSSLDGCSLIRSASTTDVTNENHVGCDSYSAIQYEDRVPPLTCFSFIHDQLMREHKREWESLACRWKETLFLPSTVTKRKVCNWTDCMYVWRKEGRREEGRRKEGRREARTGGWSREKERNWDSFPSSSCFSQPSTQPASRFLDSFCPTHSVQEQDLDVMTASSISCVFPVISFLLSLSLSLSDQIEVNYASKDFFPLLLYSLWFRFPSSAKYFSGF